MKATTYSVPSGANRKHTYVLPMSIAGPAGSTLKAGLSERICSAGVECDEAKGPGVADFSAVFAVASPAALFVGSTADLSTTGSAPVLLSPEPWALSISTAPSLDSGGEVSRPHAISLTRPAPANPCPSLECPASDAASGSADAKPVDEGIFSSAFIFAGTSS